MFSKRTSWDLGGNAGTLALAERHAAGLEVFDLTESNPTRAGLGLAPDALRAAMVPPGLERYEPDPRGLLVAREAIAAYYGERAIDVAPEKIVLSASSSEAYAWLFKLLCDPGDEILVPSPGYPLFECLAELESVRVRAYPSRWDGSAWRIDVHALASAITPATRAIVVVNPGNPTGAFVTREEHAQIAALGLPIISDEVFGDYGNDRHREGRASSLLTASADVLTFVLSGFSKVLALPQLKLGWTVVLGPGAVEALARLEVVADTYLSVATPVQLAAKALLSHRAAIQAAIRSRVAANLAVLRAALGSSSAASLLEPEGGWCAIVRVPRVQDDAAWIADLLAEGVLVQPGFFFEFDGPGYLVVSLLPPLPEFAAGADRLARRVAMRAG